MDPYTPRELTQGELVARGLMPPGPLAPAVTSTDPDKNAQAIRETVNPPVDPFASFFSPKEMAKRVVNSPLVEAGLAIAAPWSKGAGGMNFLKNMALGGGLSAAETAARTGDPTQTAISGGVGAGGMGVLGGLGKLGRYLGSAIPKNMFAEKQAAQIADWLKSNVPAWADLPSDAKGLYAMAHKGQKPLSDMFEAAVREAKASIPEGTQATIPAKVAVRAGITSMRDLPITADDKFGMVNVDARELLERLPKLRKLPEVRQAALNALAEVMPEGVMPEARRAYQVGQGWREFNKQGKVMAGEEYNPVEAMKTLTTKGEKALLSRDMEPLWDIIRGPGQKPIQQVQPAGLGYQLGKEALGAGLGGAAGGPLGAGAGAAAATLIPRPTLYKNVPPQTGLSIAPMEQFLIQQYLNNLSTE